MAARSLIVLLAIIPGCSCDGAAKNFLQRAATIPEEHFDAEPTFRQSNASMTEWENAEIAVMRESATPSANKATSADCKPCTLSSDEACALQDMSEKTCVYPGGLTTCLDGDFAFVVTPGDADKLLFFFQGGGACVSKHIQLCTKSLEDGGAYINTGVFNKSDERNPFRSYTIVNVPFCSGDLFIGNSSWEVGAQFGYQNALAAVTWTKENLNSESAKLTSMVLSGDSAGSLGTQFWARYMLETMLYDEAAVLADSYAGVFPDSAIVPIMKNWKSTDLPLWSSSTKAKIADGSITVGDIFDETIASSPCVRFANIQSKEDPIQRDFYCVLKGGLIGKGLCLLAYPSSSLYYQANLFFERYNAHANYIAYIVDGDQHTFTETPYFYTASPMGPKSGSENMLYDWVREFVAGETKSGPVTSQCSGTAQPNSQKYVKPVDYCDKTLLNKTLSFPDTCNTVV